MIAVLLKKIIPTDYFENIIIICSRNSRVENLLQLFWYVHSMFLDNRVCRWKNIVGFFVIFVEIQVAFYRKINFHTERNEKSLYSIFFFFFSIKGLPSLFLCTEKNLHAIIFNNLFRILEKWQFRFMLKISLLYLF